MVKKIHHLGVAVKDLDAAIKLFKEAFDLSSSSIREVKEREIRIALLSSGGNEIFELIQPTTPENSTAKFIAEKGEGFLHVCLPVENVEEAIVALRKKGVEALGPPRVGVHGVKIVFIDPKTTYGLPIELIEQQDNGGIGNSLD
ncbi:MAG: methylmalonyl-CoA/ethylmalonyl-CoA epimerase [Thermoproteota archaeon]|nr:methylmalonyl-CoA/ethylmalonyl-CoA epimerase [Thermoproteota archaeon]